MILISSLCAIGASAGWAVGSMLAERPARALGAFAFTQIQFIACAILLVVLCSAFSLWSSANVRDWPAYAISILTAVVGHIALTACLRRGGARRIEVILSLRAPIVVLMAYLWLGETLGSRDLLGGTVCIVGVLIAVVSRDRGRKCDSDTTRLLSTFLGLGLLATVCNGAGYLVMKPALEDGTNPLVVSAIRLIGAAAIMSAIGLWPSRTLRAQTPVTPFLFVETVLPGVIGYVIASSLLLYAFATLDAGIAAILGSLAPVLILPIQAVRNKSLPGLGAIFGAALAVAGTTLIILQ